MLVSFSEVLEVSQLYLWCALSLSNFEYLKCYWGSQKKQKKKKGSEQLKNSISSILLLYLHLRSVHSYLRQNSNMVICFLYLQQISSNKL